FPVSSLFRVFKKTSGNGHISLYLGKRDFVDYIDSVEVVDGVVKVDPSGLNGRKVFVYLACVFRYGCEDLDVIGLSFRRDIWIQHVQVYPPTGESTTKSPLQESLLNKVGEQGFPFAFQMPTNLPCSVALQPLPNNSGKACGVEFEVKGYVANAPLNTCRLMIRKIQFASPHSKPGPKTDMSKQFVMTDKPLHLDVSLEKETYYHGDPITVKVKINNETTKVVKKIKVSDQILKLMGNVGLSSSQESRRKGDTGNPCFLQSQSYSSGAWQRVSLNSIRIFTYNTFTNNVTFFYCLAHDEACWVV
uniref:Arrestin-C n=1 Tax=Mastacembelus armatus TaxID=205130 RepID=A0A7N8YHV9_9TELE